MFALDNLDWRKKTLDGGSFHATTAIVIENTGNTTTQTSKVNVPTTSIWRSRTLADISDEAMPAEYVTTRDRLTSRSLQNISNLESLETQSNGISDHMLLIWRIGRIADTSQLSSLSDREHDELPGFSAFCARISTHHEASKIGYLSLIPASPTDTAVMKEEIARIVKISEALGCKYAVVTGDQA